MEAAMDTKPSSLLGSNTRTRESDESERNRSRYPQRHGVTSRYMRGQRYESDAVAAPKSDGSNGTSPRSTRLDLEALPLGLEAPSDGQCQSEDASNMMKPRGPNPESPTSLNLAGIASKEDAFSVIGKEESPSSTTLFGKTEIVPTKSAKKCSHCHETSHSKPRCPLLPCNYCSEIGHLASSCPFKTGRYNEGKTRTNAVQTKRRGLGGLDPAIKGKRSEQARGLDPAAIGEIKEEGRARPCDAMKKKARRKHKEERDAKYGSLPEKEREKEAKRQYDHNRYANPAIKEKARARYHEAAKKKAGLKDNKETDDDDPAVRLSGSLEAKRQYGAKRQRDPAMMESHRQTKRPRHEVIGLKGRNLKDEEERCNDEDDDDDDSGPIKTRISKRQFRADLDEELDRLKETDLRLAKAIIRFHARLTTVLKTSQNHKKLQDFGESDSSSLVEH